MSLKESFHLNKSSPYAVEQGDEEQENKGYGSVCNATIICITGFVQGML